MLLFRYSRLWYCPSSEQATRVHADVYTATRIRAYIKYIHTNGHLCCDVLDDYEFTRF